MSSVERFAYLGPVTKDTIAAAIAKHIRRRAILAAAAKTLESEDARMGIFDAAALALTFFKDGSGADRRSP